jgi:hypothetical protein
VSDLAGTPVEIGEIVVQRVAGKDLLRRRGANRQAKNAAITRMASCLLESICRFL